VNLHEPAGGVGRCSWQAVIMVVTNPWLAGPSPTRRLDRDRLQERILNLLSSQNMCVLATAGADGPLATPVRYFHLDFTIIFTAAGSSPKMRNIRADPRVSVGVFAPLVGQASSRGAQLFGNAHGQGTKAGDTAVTGSGGGGALGPAPPGGGQSEQVTWATIPPFSTPVISTLTPVVPRGARTCR